MSFIHLHILHLLCVYYLFKPH